MNIELDFKTWTESIFGRGILDEPEPASEIPMWINKIQNGAFPSYNAPESDPLMSNIKKKFKNRNGKNNKT